MLVVTRKQGETIRIGEDVTVTIVRYGDRQVRVGVEAPRNVKVLRGELAAGKEGDDATPGICPTPTPRSSTIRTIFSNSTKARRCGSA